ncbi:ABC transporter ATP-binding protein [Microbacterium gorillae]|uniref:ABC transporter ATP-binding protein n=1 Tax=Microbacterium gorillae TaxID=1231063 RepID=UPI00058BC554|nr:ABC transporter ATP-binding protein [Microbacterium gorillae]
MSAPLLSVRDLAVSFPSEAGIVDAVRGVSFDLHAGKTLAIVGESGSGKSVTSLAVMGLHPKTARITGSIQYEGRELLGLSDQQMSRLRGQDISMIFQDPLSSLTPVFTIGDQIIEALQVHDKHLSQKAAAARAVDLLRIVGIPRPEERLRSFPHEFSGGMRQRVVIAIAMANNPRVIIADEPTTALDVTIQAQILDVLDRAQEETGAGVLLITHDMGVVAHSADDVLVMYAGKPVEKGSVDEVFENTRMPYSIGLLAAIPRVDQTADEPLTPIPGNPPILIGLPDECPFVARCPIATEACRTSEPPLIPVDGDLEHMAACIRLDRTAEGHVYPTPEIPPSPIADVPREQRETILKVTDLGREFPLTRGALVKRRIGTVHAVDGVSFDIREGETLAIVGESGSGKSTTLLEIMDMKPQSGSVELTGVDVSTIKGGRAERKLRRNAQIVFQDPMGALDPRMTVGDILAEPLRSMGYDGDISARVTELMDLVGLNRAHVERFASAFSGGQRQRIGIARALATNPRLVVLDEPVSALDVSIQAGVINLLEELKAKLKLSYLFVAHDLSVVRHIADRVGVMYLGKFVEFGDTEEIFDNPTHPYTKALLSAIPIPDPKIERTRDRIVLTGDLPSPASRPQGCPFVTRCPLYQTLTSEEDRRRCETVPPALITHGRDHADACHFSSGVLTREVA